MSNEFVIGIIFFIFAPLYDHFIKSYKWIGKLMYCMAIGLFLSIIPDKYYNNLEIPFIYKYLFISFAITLLLLFFTVLEKTRKAMAENVMRLKEPEQKTITEKQTAQLQSVSTQPTRADILKERQEKQIQALNNLSQGEKEYLKNFVKDKTATLSTFDPIALSLYHSDLILILQNYPDHREIYKIDDFVLIYLKDNPKLLE